VRNDAFGGVTITSSTIVEYQNDSANFVITFSNGPTAPSSLTATAASTSQINLAWADNSSNETGFKIERKTGSGGTYSQIATVGPM